MSDTLHQFLAEQGYTELVLICGKLCGLHGFMFTTGLMVGLDGGGYELRYCYELAEDARAALNAWDGKGHPSGPWIKAKGRIDGKSVDLLNPGLMA